MIKQLYRWLSERTLVIVADGSYAVVEFLAHLVVLPQVTLVTRMRLDGALSDPAPRRAAGKKGRPAVKGKRQPTLANRLAHPATAWQTSTVCWYGGVTRSVEMATDTALWYHAGVAPVPLGWVLIRDPEGKFAHAGPCCVRTNMSTRFRSWPGLSCGGRSRVTFHEVCTNLGVQTQRQWSHLAILRTTPALLGLFSDTLAFVRQHLWPSSFFARSSSQHDLIEIPRALFDRLVDTLAFTA